VINKLGICTHKKLGLKMSSNIGWMKINKIDRFKIASIPKRFNPFRVGDS
jgi:hypothetical protein